MESKSGEGSTFWFILPRNEVPLKYEAALRTPTNNLRLWEDKKVLIAEDDQSNYYFLYEALKETGIQVVWSKDGEETMALFREHKDLDLVLMDINMPLVNGYECTRMMKKERPDLPVIAQTAYAMSGEREISREAGCDDYLAQSPLRSSELLGYHGPSYMKFVPGQHLRVESASDSSRILLICASVSLIESVTADFQQFSDPDSPFRPVHPQSSFPPSIFSRIASISAMASL